MKKLGIALFMVLILIALVACGGNNNNVENHHIMSEQEIQDLLASLESSEPDMSANQPEEYATFGETLILGHRFEITIIDNVTITRSLRSPVDGESALIKEVYDGEIIMIPAILTNIDDRGHYFSQTEISVIAPSGEAQGHTVLSAATSLMREAIGVFSPTIHRTINAG